MDATQATQATHSNLICNTPRVLNKIQSHGFLCIVCKDTFEIFGYSENVLDIFKNNNNFIDVIDVKYRNDIKVLLLSKIIKASGDFIFEIGGVEYFCHYYKTDGVILLEFEEKKDNLYENINVMHEFLMNLKHDEDMSGNLLRMMYDLTKYDRIVLYKFNDDWSGMVVAEHKSSELLPSYLNKYFPESDIPSYVRSLFYRNKYRYIKDTEDVGCDVIFKRDDIKDCIDLSMSDLISVQGNHLKYLKNMKIKSTFSMAMIVDNKLWGFVSCHDLNNDKYLRPNVRKCCSKMIDIYSDLLTRMNKRKNDDCYGYLQNMNDITKTFDNICHDDFYKMYEYTMDCISKYIKAEYTISNINNKNIYKKYIDLPDYKCEVVSYLINNMIDQLDDIVVSNNVKCDVFDKISFNDKLFCGMIFIKLKNNNWVAFIKSETVVYQTWAGDPSRLNCINDIVLPRENFEDVYKVLYDTSLDWGISQENIKHMRDILDNILLKYSKEYSELFVNNDDIDKKREMILANLTHEIRNPLSAIKGIFEILKDECDMDKMLHHDIINDGMKITSILQTLINNMIDFTKNKYGYTSVHLKEINMHEILKNIYNIYKYSTNKSVELKINIDESIPESLIGDNDKINQILHNLVSNSCKYTFTGGINVNIRSMGVINNINWIQMEVSDTGIGIPKEKQHLLFREFEQLNDLNSYSSGLGLSLCYQLITILNGTIDVRSEESWGTSFICKIPFNVVGGVNKNHNVSNGLNKTKVLVVDDSMINIKIITKKLEKTLCELYVAYDGRQAIEILRKNENNIDIIFMDTVMPVMDGIAATQVMRKELNYKGVIVGVSGRDNENYKQQGFNYYLIKPIDYNVIYKMIDEV